MAEDGKIVYRIVVDSTGAVLEAEKAGQTVGEHFGTGAGTMEEVWTGAARRIGAAFVNMAIEAAREAGKLLVGSIETGMEFDAAMSRVQAVSGATADEMEVLRQNALDMGKNTKFTATEAAEALNYMGMAGWKADEMIAGLPGIMNLAAASGEALGSTSDIVTDALTAFGLSADQAQHFADVLASAAANSNTNVGMMGETFKYVAPVAGALNYTIEDTAVAIGLMANSGIKASMAGTALRSFLTRLAKPTDESGAAMEMLGIALDDGEGHMYSLMDVMKQLRYSFQNNITMSAEDYADALHTLNIGLEQGAISESAYDKELYNLNLRAFGANETLMAMYAAMLGGQRAMSGLLAIINATDADFDSLTDSIYGASEIMAKTADGSVIPYTEALAKGLEIIELYNGASEAMKETMLDNLQGDVTRLQSAWNIFQIELADKFEPILREIMPQLIELVNRLTENLQDADWSGLGDMILSIAEKLIDFLDYIINHGDEVLHTVEGIVATILGLKGFSLGKGAGGLLGNLFGFGKGAGASAAGTAASAAGSAGVSGAGLAAAGTAAAFALPASLAGGMAMGIRDYFKARQEAISAATMDSSASLAELKANLDEQNRLLEEAQQKYQKAEEAELWTSMSGEVSGELAKATAELDAAKAAQAAAKEQYEAALAAVEESTTDTESTVSETLSGLSDNANVWGSDMMVEFANGLTEGANSWVIPAVVGIASAIGSYLHHSEPDVGPLSNDSEWMPDMIRGFASQIEQYGPLITGALENSLNLSGIPTIGDIERSLSVNVSALGAAARQLIEIPVNLDGREIARATAWSMSEQLAWEEI